MSLLPSLLNFSLHPPTNLSLSKPQFLFLKPSQNSISSSSAVKFSLHHQQYNAVDDEAEELVIGDCLVFEEGVFEDPYLNEALNSTPVPAPSTRNSVQRGGNVIEIEPENLIPEKWKEAQAEINVTKKERRKMKQALEFGKRLEKKREGLRPIGMSVDEHRTVMLAEWKPLVLDNPTFVNEEKVEKDSGGSSDSDGDDGGGGGVESGRVAPRNPKLAVYGASLDDISEFLNSRRYDPEAAKKPDGPRNKLFTKEEKELMNKRVPDLATATTGKWHPLHTVAAAGEFHLVDALLKHNVDINVLDKDGLTALHKAIIGKKQAIFNYLLRESANPFVRDREGATLMHYAVLTTSFQMIKILLLYNVDINLQDNDGWTPLHLAVQSRRTDIVKLLLIKGADKTLKNQDGLTPLDLCLYSGRDTRTYELIKLLKQLPGPRRRALQPYHLTS